MMRNSFHVVWSNHLMLWVCVAAGIADIILDVGTTKNAVLQNTRQRCLRLKALGIPCQMVVHLQNGSFEYENTYLNDPPETKG